MLCGAVLAATVLLGVLSPDPAAADPAAPTSSPTVAPSAPGQAPDTTDCAGQAAPDAQQRWCLRWIHYTPTPPDGSPSHWLTGCSLTRTADETAICQAVTLSVETRPADGTPSVLADVSAGTAASTDLVHCDLFTARAVDHPADAAAWNALHDRCVAVAPALVQTLRPPKIIGGISDSCDPLDQQCRIEKALKDAVAAGIRTGIQGLTDFFVQAVGFMLSQLAKLVLTKSSIGDPDDAFFFSYNAAAGILLVLVFLYFGWSTIINGLRVQGGPSPVATLGGLVRAILGITFAGGIAWMIASAWDEATNALIDHNAAAGWDASLWLTALTNLSGPAGQAGSGALVLLVALFALLGLVLLFIIMLFRGLLTTGAALFGAMAMSGQVMHETRPWARTWFWTVNALAASKFFIVLLWIYGSRAAYGSNDLTTMLQALLLIWLMVLCPGVMLRLMSIFDAYLSDVNSRALVGAAAAGIGDLASLGADAAMRHLGGRAGQGGGGDAAEIMDANVADMPAEPDDGGEPADETGEGSAEGPEQHTGQGDGTDLTDGAAQATGLEPGLVDEAAQAVETGQDGGRPGDPSQPGGPADGAAAGGEPGDETSVGEPNAGEAADVEAAADSARHDVGSGELTPPGQTGASGALPVRPDAVADSAQGDGAVPTGISPAGEVGDGSGATQGTEGGAADGAQPGPDSVGLGPAGGPPSDLGDGPDAGSGGQPPEPPDSGPGPTGGAPSGGGPVPAGGGGGAAGGTAAEAAVVAV
ncbi:hypothetical protein GCM10022255_069270 [Dactylosporangium darangshiense]|uniref:TrbL/VirB6 plasmid conjugal transfer protein n=1 Tax=Dactylosporangium darangshiense TaxID=579108 RepID=A0ABP8DHS9_9ACTN